MTLTYIFHSGFALETDSSILVFDYWMDPATVIPGLLQTTKAIYVFSSHFHEDHFNRRIFLWKKENPNITYILSKDILKRRRAEKDDADVWLSKGMVWEDRSIRVIASGSNDSGVSWIVETEGKRIFHAGDLNNWYARFLNDEFQGGIIHSEEFNEDIDPIYEEKRFLGELKDTNRLLREHSRMPLEKGFDIVMFPVDGRIGNGYTRGGRQFIERFNTSLFVPMHFVTSGNESAWRMDEFCREKNIPFWKIEHEGEMLEVE